MKTDKNKLLFKKETVRLLASKDLQRAISGEGWPVGTTAPTCGDGGAGDGGTITTFPSCGCGPATTAPTC
jgi:hypothetical protein